MQIEVNHSDTRFSAFKDVSHSRLRRGTRLVYQFVATVLLLGLSAKGAHAIDIGKLTDVLLPKAESMTQASPMLDELGANGNCNKAPKDKLGLLDAVVESLCNNPKTRVAWANVKVQSSQVAVAKAAYLPTLSAQVQEIKDRSVQSGAGSVPFFTESNSQYHNDTLTLSWTLYDFGLRSATVNSAKRSLESALASQNYMLQSVFANTVNDYYAALVAQKNLLVALQIETDAKQVLDAASFRVSVGVVAISDKLQAKTAFLQAVYSRYRAQGARNSAVGTLAMDMGRNPTEALELLDDENTGSRNTDFVRSVDELMDQAKHNHPSLLAARADLEATKASEDMVRAQGRPTIGLIVRQNYNNQPTSSGFGQEYVSATGRDRYLGLQIDVPLFEGFSRMFKSRGANAQVESKAASVADTEQQVAIGVWNRYQELKVNTNNLDTTQQLLDNAQAAFDAAMGRYKVGVADIVEVVSTQTALANAHQQRILALAGWRNSRIQLAASLGNLGLWTLR